MSRDLPFKSASETIPLPIPILGPVVSVRRMQRPKRLGNVAGGSSGRRLWRILGRKPCYLLSAFFRSCQRSIHGVHLLLLLILTPSASLRSLFRQIICFFRTTADTIPHLSTLLTRPRIRTHSLSDTTTAFLPMSADMNPQRGSLLWRRGRTIRILIFGTSIPLLYLHHLPWNHPPLLRLPR